MSLSLGRPRTIHLEECSVRDPIDCDYPADRTKDYPPLLRSWSGLPSSFTPHWFQHQVGKMIHEVVSTGVNTAAGQNHLDALQHHQRLNDMVRSLPKSISPVNPDLSLDSSMPHLPVMRMQVEVTANAFLLALHRRHSRFHLANRSLAIDAALKVLSAQQQLFEVMGKASYKIFMLSYYSVDAGLYLAAILASHSPDNPSLTAEVKLSLRQATDRLSWIADRSVVAASGLVAIRGLYQRRSRSLARQQTPTFQDNAMAADEPNYAQYNTDPVSLPEGASQGFDPDVYTDTELQSSRSSAHAIALHSAVSDHQSHFSELTPTFDPFMGVTEMDYTLENFLSELL